MTAHTLARMLKPYRVFPREVSYTVRGQGYLLALFEQACGPYLAPSKLGSSGNATERGTCRTFQSSEETPIPSFEKVEETTAAVSVPAVSGLCIPEMSGK